MALCWVTAAGWRVGGARMCEGGRGGQRRRKRQRAATPKRRGGGLLQVLDDLTDKQYGRGQIYYGPRAAPAEAEATEEEEEWEELKPDAVLVVGGTGRTGQWVTLGLLNQGFNVRVLTREFERAEALFGASGANVDVFEGDLGGDDAALADAVRGARAVACVAGGGRALFGRRRAPCAARLVRAAAAAGVRRFVYVGDLASDAVAALRDCAMPYVVVSAGRLRDEEGGLRDVVFTPITADSADGAITRLDLAQVVCQALVYNRFIDDLATTDAEAGFEFPNVAVHVSNGNDPFIPDSRFWRDRFAALSDAFAEPSEKLE